MQQPHKLITWIVIIGVIIVTVIVVVGYVMTNNTSTPQVVAQMPMQATSSVPVQETHTTETQAVAQIAIPQSKVLLEDSILKNTNFASRLFVSDDASNVIYYFTASSGHLKIFANGVLSPEYATLLQGTVISSDQRLVVSPVMGLKKQFVVTNGVASRPYDGILHAPVLSSDGKHYVYVAFSGNSQFTVLDGKEVANDDAPGANGTSKRLKPVFSGNAARMAFITGRSDMGTRVHSNILIHDTKSGQKEEELTAHFPGLLAFSDDGKIFGYADEGEIVIRDESGEKVSERRFPLDTSGVGSLVISSDGKHWAFGNSFGAPPRKQQLWIDGKQISTLIPYGANLLSLTFNMKGDNLAYHVSGISDVGVIVHDTDGNVIGKYMI